MSVETAEFEEVRRLEEIFVGVCVGVGVPDYQSAASVPWKVVPYL